MGGRRGGGGGGVKKSQCARVIFFKLIFELLLGTNLQFSA